jgi:hypothetical protein
MKQNIFFLLLFIIVMSQFIYAASPQPQSCDCSQEINPLLINISILNQTNADLSKDLEYYKNLSGYYQNLYDSKEINVTNRELINLHQQVNNLNIEINDIRSELSFLKLTLKVSIPIISVTFFSLLGFSIYLRRKIKERRNG